MSHRRHGIAILRSKMQVLCSDVPREWVSFAAVAVEGHTVMGTGRMMPFFFKRNRDRQSSSKMNYLGDVLAAGESRAVTLGGVMVRGGTSAAGAVVRFVLWASALVCSKFLAASRT